MREKGEVQRKEERRERGKGKRKEVKEVKDERKKEIVQEWEGVTIWVEGRREERRKLHIQKGGYAERESGFFS